MRVSSDFTLSAGYLGCLMLAGCAVDDRNLQGIVVWAAGTGGIDSSGGAAGEVGESGADSGGSAGAAGEAAGQGGAGGSTAGSSAQGGKGGTTASGGTAGKGGSGGVCGCGGMAPLRCPDIDGNHVPDCDETLAENGSFDADVSNWTNDTGVVSSWRDSDARGATDSGSLGLEIQTVSDQDGNVMLGTRQCFSAAGGVVYKYAVEISVPEDAPGYRAGIQLVVHDQPACNGAPIDNVPSNMIEGSAWSVTQITYFTPPAAKSVALRLIAIKPFRADPKKVGFDNVLVRTD